MKRFLFVILIISYSVTWAKWELLGATIQFDEYADKASRLTKGNVVEMWTMRDWRTLQITNGGFKYLSEKVLDRYDCENRTMALLEVVKYPEKMGLGNKNLTITARQQEIVTDRIAPSSSGEVKLKIACDKK